MGSGSFELQELCSLIKRGIAPKYGDQGILVVNQRCIREGQIDLAQSRIHDTSARKVNDEKILKHGDILINSTGVGTAGRVGMWNESARATCDTHVTIVRPIFDRVNPKFLFYFLRANERLLHDSAEGSTGQIELKRGTIGEITSPEVSISQQEAIAEVLSSLDDKIDLLKCQNKTLEGMAEALFRQWFIEEAQDDWEEFSASDFIQHIKESEKPQSKPEVWFHHFSLPAFDDGQRPLREKGEEIKSNKYVVQPESLLVSKLNPGTPRIWFCGPSLPENSICSTEFQVIKPLSDYLGFFKCLYSSVEVVEFFSACASGTSGSHQRVKPIDIVELEFRVPSKEAMVKFSALTAPWFEKVLENREQILTLEDERNTLLPKLMSGEVRVKMD